MADPSPRYDLNKDKMLCHVNATFGRCGWQLPIVEIDFPKNPDVYRWFALYFLDGIVIAKLKNYTKSLLSPASTMIKSWAKLQPRTETLYRGLVFRQVCSKSQLLDEWKKDPSCMFCAFKSFLIISNMFYNVNFSCRSVGRV